MNRPRLAAPLVAPLRAASVALLVSHAQAQAAVPRADMQIVVVGFEDGQTKLNCPPLEARVGRCVERVGFLDLSSAWGKDGAAQRSDRSLLRLLSHLYSQVWDDLAARWNLKSDTLVSLYQKRGVGSLPAASSLLDGSAAQDERWYSLPARRSWLDEARCVGTATLGAPETSVFHTLR